MAKTASKMIAPPLSSQTARLSGPSSLLHRAHGADELSGPGGCNMTPRKLSCDGQPQRYRRIDMRTANLADRAQDGDQN
jgi:hypothetical protein